MPGLGIKSVHKIIQARRFTSLSFDDLKKMRVSIKRAKYFITCKGKTYENLWIREELITPSLLADGNPEQLNLFNSEPTQEDYVKCLTGEI